MIYDVGLNFKKKNRTVKLLMVRGGIYSRQKIESAWEEGSCMVKSSFKYYLVVVKQIELQKLWNKKG